MAGECDKDTDRQEIKPPEKTEEIRDENLLEDILINPHPKSSKPNKADSLAEILNVNTFFFFCTYILL